MRKMNKRALVISTRDMSKSERKRYVDFHFDLRKNRNWVELDHEIAKYVRELAKEQNIPARRLVNEWLKERLSSLH